MDRLIKERLRMPYYVRYMDDFVILSEDKSQLQLCKKAIEDYVKTLKLSLNQKTQIGLLSDGIDFWDLTINYRPPARLSNLCVHRPKNAKENTCAPSVITI